MEILEYQVIMARINEIEQEQLRYLDCVCKYMDCGIDVQKDNARDRMLKLREDKESCLSI